ncbi:MAG TPA: hypothetical protein VF895_06275 [Gaiellaceae bacterium]
MALLIVTELNPYPSPQFQPAPLHADVARGDLWLLVTINGNLDGQIGDFNASTVEALQVTYNQTLAGFGPDLVDFLTNVCDRDTEIVGTDTTFVLVGQSGELYPLSTSIGRFWVADDGSLAIAYDVTQCGGGYWWVVDSSGQKIPAPNFAILGHELSHAMHSCKDDLAADPEVQAIGDENALRSEHQEQLRSENPADYNKKGCGLSSPPKGGGFSWSNLCFIVSAAVDTSSVARISRLVHLRDMLLRHSALGSGVFELLFREYYQFSPRIAADMKTFPEVRRWVSELIVEPLADFYEALGSYALDDRDLVECDRDFEAAVRRFAEKRAEDGIGQKRIDEVCRHVSRISARLARADGSSYPAPRLVESSRLEWRDVLDYVADVVQGTTTRPRSIVWGLLAPLEFYWRVLVGEERGFVGFVESWLASAPLPSSIDAVSEEELRDELELLKATILRSSAVRHTFGRRLVDYSRSASFAFEAALGESGYLP